MKRPLILVSLLAALSAHALAQAPISTRPAQEPKQDSAASAAAPLDQPTPSQVEAAQWGRDVLARANGQLPPTDDRLAQGGPAPVGCVRNPDRAAHGEGGVSVGSGGYKAVDIFVTKPVGDCGQVSVGISTARGGRGVYGGRGYNPF